jgi:RNA polymerase sigma factor (sigma-70 family)
MKPTDVYIGQSDQQLAVQTSKGNQDAFAILYERRFRRLYDFAFRIVRDSDIAADVVQSTFTKTWEQLNAGKLPNNINAWIYTLARNSAIDELRRRKRLTSTDFGSVEDKEFEALATVDTARFSDPHAVVEYQELVDLVWRSANTLRPEEYSLLDMYLRQGLNANDLAEYLGVRKGTLYTRLSRLRDSLEQSIIVDFLIRRGRRDCPELDALLSKYQEMRLDKRARDEVSAHLNECSQCQENKKRYLTPSEIFSALAVLPAPLTLKDTIWKELPIIIPDGITSLNPLRSLRQVVSSSKAAAIGAGITILSLVAISTVLLINGDSATNRPNANDGGVPSTVPSAPQLAITDDTSVPDDPESLPVMVPSPTFTQISALIGDPTITPTPTSSLTPTYTPSPSATPTSSQTPTFTPSITPTVTPTSSPTQVPIVWMRDRFDGLNVGPLDGQHGWSAFNQTARVIAYTGKGKVLQVDPQPGTTIGVAKNIANQDQGVLAFDFEVMVTDASGPSLAKFEFTTTSNAGWDKKFQLYFGTSMRVNYNSSGTSANFIQSTQDSRWYLIHCVMDLNDDTLDIWVDGILVLENIPMHSGPLISVSIWGWDRGGVVLLDNLLGTK